MLSAKSSLARLYFFYHQLLSDILHSELGVLVPSGGCVPQTGIFSDLPCLEVAAVQSVILLLILIMFLLVIFYFLIVLSMCVGLDAWSKMNEWINEWMTKIITRICMGPMIDMTCSYHCNLKLGVYSLRSGDLDNWPFDVKILSLLICSSCQVRVAAVSLSSAFVVCTTCWPCDLELLAFSLGHAYQQLRRRHDLFISYGAFCVLA